MSTSDSFLPKFLTSKYWLVIGTIVAVLYGVSYQLFRHFDTEDRRGLSASISYIAMSEGNFEVTSTHRHRFIVPWLAGQIKPILQLFISNPVERDKLAFYVVNFLIVGLTALLLYLILEKLGFNGALCLLGIVFFLCSRTTVYTVGAPLVDSIYYFAIAIVFYGMIAEKSGLIFFP